MQVGVAHAHRYRAAELIRALACLWYLRGSSLPCRLSACLAQLTRHERTHTRARMLRLRPAREQIPTHASSASPPHTPTSQNALAHLPSCMCQTTPPPKGNDQGPTTRQIMCGSSSHILPMLEVGLYLVASQPSQTPVHLRKIDVHYTTTETASPAATVYAEPPSCTRRRSSRARVFYHLSVQAVPL